MISRLQLTTARAVDIYKEMIACRREYRADCTFFKMTDFWDDQCRGSSLWAVKTYRSSETEDFKRKAGVVALEDRVTLTADERLFANAREGCKLSNFILAHELGHVALDHHARGAVTKNFQLYSGPSGMSNLPPTLEELEANYAAVFFQCGVALADTRLTTIDLAHRAFSDVHYVGKAQRIVRLSVFQHELSRPRPVYQRVVL